MEGQTSDKNIVALEQTASVPAKYISVSEKLKKFRPEFIRKVKHYPTGIHKLDQLLGGGLYAGLTFLGATPGTGKSTLILQIASEIAATGQPVLFYSLEMSVEQLEAKILNREIHRKYPDSTTTARGIFTAGEADSPENIKKWEMIEEIKEDIGDKYWEFYIKEKDQASFSSKDIEKDVGEFIKYKNKLPVVFVDYLQILSPVDERKTQNEKQKNDENVIVLNDLSNKYNLPIVVISSLNRDSYKSEEKPKPMGMAAFKETGSIEYTASVILGMQQRGLQNRGDGQEEMNDESETVKKPKGLKELELVFLKQRYGDARGVVDLDFYGAKDLFEGTNDPEEESVEDEDTVSEESMDQEEEFDLEQILIAELKAIKQKSMQKKKRKGAEKYENA